LVRTAIIIVVLAVFVCFAGKWSNPLELPAKTWLLLGLSGLATGAAWVCYFRALQVGDASKVAPVDKLSLVRVAVFAFFISWGAPIIARMDRYCHGGGRCARSCVQTLRQGRDDG
jgi:uncharacterized membrane protein